MHQRIPLATLKIWMQEEFSRGLSWNARTCICFISIKHQAVVTETQKIISATFSQSKVHHISCNECLYTTQVIIHLLYTVMQLSKWEQFSRPLKSMERLINFDRPGITMKQHCYRYNEVCCFFIYLWSYFHHHFPHGGSLHKLQREKGRILDRRRGQKATLTPERNQKKQVCQKPSCKGGNAVINTVLWCKMKVSVSNGVVLNAQKLYYLYFFILEDLGAPPQVV